MVQFRRVDFLKIWHSK